MELVTVFNSFTPVEAQVVRSMLDAAGITATVVHELSALSNEGYALAAGGIEVKVPENQAEEAKALLAAGEEPSSS